MVMDQHSNDLKKLKIYYVKGHYYGYRGSPKVSRLIYPCPEKNLAGLGTHLTVDLAGKMKFGPDVKYINDPNDYHIEEGERLDDFLNAIREYLPEVRQEGLYADYAGIRPKLQAPGDPFRDFVIREEIDNNLPGFINCVGIESPGLTSSLAIGEMVETILYGKSN
ncbi:hypothetical protein K7432_006940 [Basidiobolus ranarum]|uniref:L-2-hydroxyglutarate dehydrogenase, mitochondrial n=1 Tax=Basidiobolus ranarum TaxID=34480 RepID=A0ABR2W0W5_9FUNG